MAGHHFNKFCQLYDFNFFFPTLTYSFVEVYLHLYVHESTITDVIVTTKGAYFLILIFPEESMPKMLTGIITYTGTLLCLDDFNILDLDFSWASMLQIHHG